MKVFLKFLFLPLAVLFLLAGGCASVSPPVPYEGWRDEQTGIEVYYGRPARPHVIDSIVETSAWSLTDRRREALRMLLDNAAELGVDAVMEISLGISGRGVRRVGTASGILIRWEVEQGEETP